MKRLIAGVATAAIAAGCGGYQSSYVRQSAPATELVWRYDKELQVTRNGEVVAEGGWRGLDAVVRCEPRAREWASTARSRHRNGTIALWAGLIGMIGGTLLGTSIALSDTDDTDNLVLGLGIVGGSLLFGLASAPTGAVLRSNADARAIDAVNLYNDHLASGAPCPQ